jgi:hypothetical protein
MMVAPYVPSSLGCLPSEVVLRGGYLREPLVLPRLQLAGGRQFVMLLKSGRELSLFLTGKPSRVRPLQQCLVFERLATLRNEAYKAIVHELAKAAQDNMIQEGEDLAASLDLDAPEGGAGEEGRPKKRARRADGKLLRAQMPAILEVEYVRHGQAPWRVAMLAQPGNKAPAMEVTAESMQTLFELVDREVLGGEVCRAQIKGEKSPRGPAKARTYWCGTRRRWITKHLLSEVPSPAFGRRKYRTLTRRGSDEATGSLGDESASTTASPTARAPAKPRRPRTRAARPRGKRVVESGSDEHEFPV